VIHAALRERRRTAGRCALRLCVLSRLWGTAARAQLLLVPHAGLRRLRQHGRLARPSSGVLLLVSRLSSATALTAHQPRRYCCIHLWQHKRFWLWRFMHELIYCGITSAHG